MKLLILFSITCSILLSAGCAIMEPKQVLPPEVSPAKHEFLSALKATVPSGRIAAHFYDDGRLRYVGGADLAQAVSCGKQGALLTSKTAQSLIQCLMLGLRPLLTVGSEDTTTVPWAVSRVTTETEGQVQYVFAHQIHRGLPVKGSEFVITVVGGMPFSIHGTLVPPSRMIVTAKAPVAVKTVVSTASSAVGRPLGLRRRFYDPELQEIVAELRAVSGTPLAVLFSEDRLQLISTHNPANLVLEPRPTDVANFADLFGWQPNTQMPAQTLEVEMDVGPGPRGTEKVCLDHGSDDDDGEPKVGGSRDDENPSTACGNYSTAAVVPKRFGGFPTSDDGHLASVYFWMHDLAAFANSSVSSYNDWLDWDQFENENLKVAVVRNRDHKPCGFKNADGCIYTNWNGTEYRIVLPQNGSIEFPSGERIPSESTRNLRVISHEYGHYIHLNYGFDANSASYPEGAIAEGFADHNVLRYALFRHDQRASRSHDSIFTSSYAKLHFAMPGPGMPVGTFGFRDHRIKEHLSNGEFFPAPWNPNDTAAWTRMYFRPDDPGTKCHRDNFEPYNCGALIPIVYWTLAHNKHRFSYRKSLTVGLGFHEPEDDIISPGTPATPRDLANAAYTIAIATLPGSPDVQDFFVRVHERYEIWELAGFLGSHDVDSVKAVLNGHCLGLDHGCDTLHKTTWQHLPTVRTKKATFANTGNQSHYFRGSDMTPLNGARRVGFGTPDATAYMHLDGPGETAKIRISFPESGYYSFHFAVRPQLNAAAWISKDGGVPVNWAPDTPPGSWVWTHNGPSFCFSAGPHEITIAYDGELSVEAVWLTKTQPATCPVTEPPPPPGESPPPPLRCPPSQQCCPSGPDTDGTCTGQCWPRNMECP